MSQEKRPFDREMLMNSSTTTKPIDLSEYEITEEVLRLVPCETAMSHRIVPLVLFDDILFCALNAEGPTLGDTWRETVAQNDVRFLTNFNVHLVAATSRSFAEAFAYYEKRHPNLGNYDFEGALHTSRGVLQGGMQSGPSKTLEGQTLAALEVKDNAISYLQRYYGVPAVDIRAMEIGTDFPTFPLALARRYEMIAIGRGPDGRTRVAMAEPHNSTAAKFLDVVFGEGKWEKLVALQRDITQMIETNYTARRDANASLPG
jgi:hypothetical protein